MAARSGGVDCIPCEWEAAAQALPGMGRVCVAVPVFMAACVCVRGGTRASSWGEAQWEPRGRQLSTAPHLSL